MAGTRSGGLKTTKTVKAKYGKDHYKKIGAMGGKASSGPDYQAGGKKPSGFAAMTPEQRRLLGAKGGKLSRKTGPNSKPMARSLAAYESQYGDPTMQPNPAVV